MKYEVNERGGWIVPDKSVIGAGTNIPAHSTLGNECTLGDWCKLGDWCMLGDWCTLGDGCKLGDWCKLGDGCNWLGVTVSRWLTLANVDGSGRQVKCVIGKCGACVVEAGCFRGTPEEFTARATSEGKHVYAAVIQAVFAAMAREGGEG